MDFSLKEALELIIYISVATMVLGIIHTFINNNFITNYIGGL